MRCPLKQLCDLFWSHGMRRTVRNLLQMLPYMNDRLNQIPFQVAVMWMFIFQTHQCTITVLSLFLSVALLPQVITKIN